MSMCIQGKWPMLSLHTAILLSVAAAGGAVQAEDGPTPAVLVRTVSDLDDPQAIRPARPLAIDTWLKPEDFPAGTFEPGKQRGLNLKLLVDAAGKVTGCTNYGPENELSTRTCGLIAERARFVHAIDAKGTPKPSERVMIVFFYGTAPAANLPPSPAPPPPGWRNTRPVLKDPAVLQLAPDPQTILAPSARVAVAISEKGRVTGCRILASIGTDAGDAALCRRIGAARFEPARDPEGRKVASESLVLSFKVTP